jgi:hypothetical protein
MKNKSFSGKYILYVIIFMVTAIVTFISMHYKTESAASVLMSEATLPVVMAKTEAGTLYNAMHGYTCEVDYSRLSTDLTLLILIMCYKFQDNITIDRCLAQSLN